MISSFSAFSLSEPLLRALSDMGFESPTEVQSLAIPRILNHEDLIVMSKTGSGKTAAFGVPVLQMVNPVETHPQVLILTPTRELAVQVNDDLTRLGAHLPHQMTAVYGQHNMNTEVQALKKGVTVLTGTPGRVQDHIRHNTLNTSKIRFLILDEADRMMDMGFMDQVMRIIRTLPKERVTLLFSATMPPEVRRICQGYMKQPFTIEIESATKTVDTIDQFYHKSTRSDKPLLLDRVLTVEQPESCMIFCNTRVAVDKVQSFLSRRGYASAALHGDIPQNKRSKTIALFKEGAFPFLVATDVAARGIHIEGLSLVINFDVPSDRDSYVHRIGRTGRAGLDGCAITLVTSEDQMSLYEIEEHIGVIIDEVAPPSEEEYQSRKASAALWMKESMEKYKRLLPPEPPKNNTEGPRPPRNKPASRNPGNGPRSPHGNSAKPASGSDGQVAGRSEGSSPSVADKGRQNPRPPQSGPRPQRQGPAPQRHPAASAAASAEAPAKAVSAPSVQAKPVIPAVSAAPAPSESAARPAGFFQKVLTKLFGK